MSIANDTDVPTKTLVVSWSPPDIPNGVITEYDVKLTNLDEPKTTILQSQSSPLKAEDLASYARYEVTVRASTSVGEGPWNEADTVLTAEHCK